MIGKRTVLSLSNNKTGELWKNFMSRRKEIQNTAGREFYSVNLYGQLYFDKFNPDTEFEKWAAVEVTGFDALPAGMETLILPEGLYAVFTHQGSSEDSKTFHYIFESWLPNSEYQLDDRPHFEILGDKYKNNDPNSEEEIWIPVKQKRKQ